MLDEQRWITVAEEGDSPVVENAERKVGIQSTTGHEESRGKQGGPPPKAKYYLVTDRGIVA